MTPRKLLLRLALAGLALGLGLVLGLALAELLVRAFGLGPEFQVVHRELFQLSADPALGYELRPLAPDGDGHINSAGFRDREFTRAKPPGVFRIVAIGDSVTFGQPKQPDANWPKALERALGARPKERAPSTTFEVLNLGVTGYNGLQVAERLRALGLAYEPDLVLYGYVLNDPQELSIELEALRDLRAAAEQRWTAGLEHGLRRALAYSHLYLWLRSRLAPELPPTKIEFTHKQDPAYEAFQSGDARGDYFRRLHEDPDGRARLRASLDRMAETTRAAHVPLVLVLFPLLLDPRDGPYPLHDVHALVAEEARARGFAVVDLESALTSCERCAADFLHPNERGARAAGEAVLEQLERLGYLPGSPAPAGQR